MPYLIDGHNLVAAMDQIDLDDPDDEIKLVELLAARVPKVPRRIDVYFDRGMPGQPAIPRTAGVQAYFITPPRSADDAILAHINRLGKEAPNWTVVSSDSQIRKAAQRSGARTVTSEEFAKRFSNEPESEHTKEPEKPTSVISEEELAFWESLFRQGSPDHNDPPT
jgi:predicted RNA-binding protein with PIN domain